LRGEASRTSLEQRQNGHLSYDAEYLGGDLGVPGEGVDLRIVLAQSGFEEREAINSPCACLARALEKTAHPRFGRARLDSDFTPGEERCLDGLIAADFGCRASPGRAVLAFVQGGVNELEPDPGLGARASCVGEALLEGYVPRGLAAGMGPEHFTLVVRHGVW
jgi:hypothetical protein